MNSRAQDQRIGQALAQENLWRAKRGTGKQDEWNLNPATPARTTRVRANLSRPVPFWMTVATAAAVAVLVSFVTYALGVQP